MIKWEAGRILWTLRDNRILRYKRLRYKEL